MPSPHGFDAASHERNHGWRSLLFKLAVCAGVTALSWRLGHWAGLLVSLMLWGRAFADDLVALAAVACRALRRRAFAPVEGQLYQFKGQRVRVLDDETQPQRWIAVDDLAAALGAPVPARRLAHSEPAALLEQRDGLYLQDDVALAWLRQQRSDRASRLAQWLEREVWFPARGRAASRMKKGAPDGAPEA